MNLFKTLALPFQFLSDASKLSYERYSVGRTTIIFPLPNSRASRRRNLILKWDKSLVLYL